MVRTLIPPSMRLGDARESLLVIAAADSVNKEGADVVCTGTADQVLINAAIASIRGKPGRVLFRAGYYSLTDEILIDTAWITLEGENYPFWNYYYGPNGPVTFPRSAPGVPGRAGGSLFVQNTANKGAFRVGTNFFIGSRYSGISFVRLAMWGPTGTGTAIYDPSDTDFGRMEGCMIHGFLNGIDVAWDNPEITNCSIQDTAGGFNGTAVRFRGYRGSFTNSTVFQVGGTGIHCGAIGMTIANNVIGLTNGDGVILCSNHIKFIGNEVLPWGLADVGAGKTGLLVANLTLGNKMDKDATGCIIVGNNFNRTGAYMHDPITNVGIGGGNCIQIGGPTNGATQYGPHANVDYTVISGNAFDTEQASPGRAIALEGASSYTSITGNTVRGPMNNNQVGVINLGTGTGNKMRGNTGPLVGADVG